MQIEQGHIAGGQTAIPTQLGQTLDAQTSSRRVDVRKSQLGIRQKLVERKMLELEAKFTAAAEQLRAKDAQRADRLIATYQKAKEQSLTKKIAENVNSILMR